MKFKATYTCDSSKDCFALEKAVKRLMEGHVTGQVKTFLEVNRDEDEVNGKFINVVNRVSWDNYKFKDVDLVYKDGGAIMIKLGEVLYALQGM